VLVAKKVTTTKPARSLLSFFREYIASAFFLFEPDERKLP